MGEKKLTAADAINAASARKRVSNLPPPAIAELRKICEYNDKQISRNKRVGSDTTIKILQGFGWTGRSHRALDMECVDHLSRTSYATP